ncbi:MAG: cation-transporting P-type ATPase [Verrucomicrobiales bacterium]|nr:cation-transporting P-type ATPase [Verrucomicrobiales bacterium]
MEPAAKVPEHIWSKTSDEVVSLLGTSPTGLTGPEVEKRLEMYGPNSVVGAAPVSAWEIWWRQFRSLIVALLVIAAVIAFSTGDLPEGIAVIAVVFINALIGFFTELKASQSMEALKKMSRMTARVVRGGNPAVVDSDGLVPGDVVVFEPGDMVPADIRLFESNSLQSDESALTGESLPVRKSTKPVREDTPLAERTSMIYRGARITAGTGRGVVTGTGSKSELGKISEMVRSATHHTTPLEKQLDRLGYRLVWITLGLMLIMTLAGLARGIELLTMVQTSIALSIAAIPEGLPVVATIALANGLWKMARNHAVINHLSAVETLGSTGIICTDKTGTLTENRMTVTEVWSAQSSAPVPADSKDIQREMLQVCILCNNAALGKDAAVGDPLEVSLLEWAAASGLHIAEVKKAFPRTGEIPFDAVARKMTTVHSTGSKEIKAVKGAAEAVLPLCRFEGDEQPDKWEERNRQMASQGLRVIAVARGEDGVCEGDYTFLGLIGLIDPPRKDIASAVNDCRSAGIRIVMVTGDQAPTAKAIAGQIGLAEGAVLTGTELEQVDFESDDGIRLLDEVAIIARSTPEQKLALVKHYQSRKHVVAMTGDGVNDAPALQQADIGVAMGLRGTDVAREAAVMVLQDDSFRTIVLAIRQGRIILINIRKFVVYLMSCNISEILVVWISMMVTGQLPLLPLQILFLNLVTDVFPALALGVTPGSPAIMSRKPGKAGQPILRRSHWITIFRHGIVIALATFAAFLYSIRGGATADEAVTISFLTLAVAQILHVFNMAESDAVLFRSEVVKNRWVWGATGLCCILLALACYVPLAARVLDLRPPRVDELLAVLCFALIPVFVESVWRVFRGFRQKMRLVRQRAQ